jgi:peptidoglycan/LPS O-acetylase OafA/YrhL
VLNLLLVQTWVPDFHLNWNYPSWSISSEWFAYLWFPIAWATVLRRMATGRRALVFLGLCWAATVALYVLGNELPFRELIRVLPTFLAGTAVYLCLVRRPACTPRLCCLPDLLLLGLAAVPFATTGRFTVALLLTGFLALVYLLAYQRQNCTALWTHCFGVYLGEVSYSLYMTHTLAQKVCYKLLPAERFIGTSAAARLAVVLGYLASVMIGSLAMYYVIERPSRRWLARPSLGGGRRPGRAARGLFANSTPPTNRGDSSARQGVGTARNGTATGEQVGTEGQAR